MSNYIDYQKSISNELLSVKDRVRNFIGYRHMGEDGRYKEIILSHVLRQHLPKEISVGTGFIINEDKITNQIDIIVYRNDIPLMFKQDEFIIAPAECVLGIIEVKTNLKKYQIKSVLKKSADNGMIIERSIFNGIFSFEADFENFDESSLMENFEDVAGVVNHICCGPNIFIKFWDDNILEEYPQKNYGIYKIADLAFGYFISNLVEECYFNLHKNRLSETLNTMFYPIEKTKEAYRRGTIKIESN